MLRPTRSAVLGLLALAVVLLTAGPAAAHTGLRESTPAAGSAVTEAPPVVTLTFSGAVRGPDVTVTGPDGAAVGGEAGAGGSVVTVPVALTRAGPQTVSWAVTSADGHPLEGVLSFDWSPPATTAPTATATATASGSPGAGVVVGAESPQVEPSEAAAAGSAEEPGTGGVLLVAGTVLLLLLAVVGAVGALVRRR